MHVRNQCLFLLVLRKCEGKPLVSHHRQTLSPLAVLAAGGFVLQWQWPFLHPIPPVALGAAGPTCRVSSALPFAPASFTSPGQGQSWPALLLFWYGAAAGEVQKDQWHRLQISDCKGSKWKHALCRGEESLRQGRLRQGEASILALLSANRTIQWQGPSLSVDPSQPSSSGSFPQKSCWLSPNLCSPSRCPRQDTSVIPEALHLRRVHTWTLYVLLPSICSNVTPNVAPSLDIS